MKKLFFFALFCASFVLPTFGADDRLGFAIGEPGAQPIAALPTFTNSDPTFTAANAKGYVFQSSAYTLCGIWYGGAAPSYLGKKDSVVTVQFLTPLTNVSGSYVLNMVSRTATNINVTVSSGVATVSGVDLSTEANLIVLAPGSTPTPTPGIQPSITLPSNYTLKWNQDFTIPAYKPFNVPSILTLKGPCLPVPGGSIWCASRYSDPGLVYTGTDGMPFTTDNGYLNIHMFNDPSGSLGGILFSVDTLNKAGQQGFLATNAYWEAKIKLPATGVPVHPAFWVTSNGDGLPVMGEIDIMEFGVQIPGSPGSYQIHLHNWSATDRGSTAGDFNVNNLSVTPDGYHIFACLIEPLKVSVYLDGKLVQSFNVGSNFNTPMAVSVRIASDNRASPALGDIACQYIRCWIPQ